MKDGEHMDVCGVEMLSQLWSYVNCNNAYWRNVLLLLTALDVCLSVRVASYYFNLYKCLFFVL